MVNDNQFNCESVFSFVYDNQLNDQNVIIGFYLIWVSDQRPCYSPSGKYGS